MENRFTKILSQNKKAAPKPEPLVTQGPAEVGSMQIGKPGRPKKEGSKSNAQRQKEFRARRKAEREALLNKMYDS